MDNLAPPSDDDPLWPATWIRALLPSAVLACLELTVLHGYGIAQALHARGFGTPRGGSLYPVLGRLEEAGAITAEWVPGPSGPARRQYTLTAAGRAQLDRDRASLAALGNALATPFGHLGAAPESEEAIARITGTSPATDAATSDPTHAAPAHAAPAQDGRRRTR